MEGVIREKHHYRSIAQACKNGKSKLSQNCNWWVMWKATGRASTSTQVAKRRTGDTMGNLLTWDMERADVLCAFYTLVFTGKTKLAVPLAGGKFYLQQQRKLKVPTSVKWTRTKMSVGPDGMLQSVHWETRPKAPQGCSQSSLKILSNLLRPRKKQMSHLCSKRARKRIQITKGQSEWHVVFFIFNNVSPASLKGLDQMELEWQVD